MDKKKIISVRNMLFISELERLEKRVSFDIAVFKGAAYLLKNIYAIDEREMSDVDLLVEKEYFNDFVKILYDNGYHEIENGNHAFYRCVLKDFPPVIFDLHSEIFGLDFWEFEIEGLAGFKNLKTFSDVDLFIISVLHAILNHAFVDEGLKDLFKRLKKKYGDEFELELKRKNKRNFDFLINFVVEEIKGGNSVFPYLLRDFMAYPFLKLTLKKHYVLNEYIIASLLTPSRIFSFLKKGRVGFRNLFMRFTGRMD